MRPSYQKRKKTRIKQRLRTATTFEGSLRRAKSERESSSQTRQTRRQNRFALTVHRGALRHSTMKGNLSCSSYTRYTHCLAIPEPAEMQDAVAKNETQRQSLPILSTLNHSAKDATDRRGIQQNEDARLSSKRNWKLWSRRIAFAHWRIASRSVHSRPQLNHLHGQPLRAAALCDLHVAAFRSQGLPVDPATSQPRCTGEYGFRLCGEQFCLVPFTR